MRAIVEIYRTMWIEGRVSESKLTALVNNGKLTSEEFIYITA